GAGGGRGAGPGRPARAVVERRDPVRLEPRRRGRDRVVGRGGGVEEAAQLLDLRSVARRGDGGLAPVASGARTAGGRALGAKGRCAHGSPPRGGRPEKRER